jgi:CPA2 family monovalent cation:H+ antiporter-2
VVLLMFGVGLHFSVADLKQVRRIALPWALLPIAAASALGAGVARFFFGWEASACLVFGLCLSVASTVVMLRALEEHRLLDTKRGKAAIGWLIVEDLAMVAGAGAAAGVRARPGAGAQRGIGAALGPDAAQAGAVHGGHRRGRAGGCALDPAPRRRHRLA